MDEPLNNGGKTTSATPSIDLLHRKIGISPAPRMLTTYENELMRQSLLEISNVTAEILRRRDDT